MECISFHFQNTCFASEYEVGNFDEKEVESICFFTICLKRCSNEGTNCHYVSSYMSSIAIKTQKYPKNKIIKRNFENIHSSKKMIGY